MHRLGALRATCSVESANMGELSLRGEAWVEGLEFREWAAVDPELHRRSIPSGIGPILLSIFRSAKTHYNVM